jgi:penicillin G amidase
MCSTMRLVVKLLVGLVALAAIIAAGGYWYLRQSLPVVNGSVTVEGLTAPVEIVRDGDGIPHITAEHKRDAFFGLGYVHAQDRLWQMEFQRRIGHGRLSEIFGAAALSQDRFLRTAGFGRAARSAWEHLPADARKEIDAYVAGVNAFIDTHHGRQLPPEFSLLRFEPEPWTGADVIVWVKMMAWDLSANYSTELLRYDLVARLGEDKAAQLMPPYPRDGLTIVTGDPTSTPGHDVESSAAAPRPAPVAKRAASRESPLATLDRDPTAAASWSTQFARALSNGHPAVTDFLLDGMRTEALGSNNWVVDGTVTATGKPLLANDPHLATHIPSLWYLAHMSAGEFDVIGATLPGAPAVAIGRNAHIAWGETNVAADVQDLYLERLDPDGKAALFRDGFEPLRIVSEEIKVKDAASVRIDVRISRHGPLISDAVNANNATAAERASDGQSPPVLPPLAFRWTALDDEDQTVVAFLKLNEARNWDEFTAAMRPFVTPSQNFVYADVDGHIGYFLPGRIPVRAAGDGSAPAQGWTGQQEWTGWIPFDDLPRVLDPPTHFIVTANHRPNPQNDPRMIGLEYPEPYRAQRITDLLVGRHGLTANDFRAIQADTQSLHARALLPLMLELVDPSDPHDRQAVEVLRTWKHDVARDSGAAPLFEAWFLKLAPVIVGDDLGPALVDRYEGRYSYVTRFLVETLTRDDDAWCDDQGTPARETCRQAVTRALHEGVAALRERFRTEMPSWRWGVVHPAVFPHQGLDAVAALRPILNRSIENGGDWSTVNVGSVAADHKYEQRAIPGYRQIVDLSPANDSRFLDAVGQSGHFLSPRYDDFLTSWQQVEHRPMRMTRAAFEPGAIGTLHLLTR